MQNLPASLSRTKTTPIDVVSSVRKHEVKLLTSLPAGKMVPLAAIPILREDSIRTSRFSVSFEMMETVEVLMNAINVRVMAYFWPNLASERFRGMDDLNRSYEKVPYTEGDPIVPYIETMSSGLHGSNEILMYMGKHAKENAQVNAAYVEAYNAIWNFRARNRSPDITERARLSTSLAPAFWSHAQYNMIVPDFDQAVIDGEVPLNITNARMPVSGIGYSGASSGSGPISTVKETGNAGATSNWSLSRGTNQADVHIKLEGSGASYAPDIYAELQDNGITVSLSNLELARKTQAFARLRQQYTGHSDEYLIAMLMDGLSIPEQAWRQPILLADKTTIFGMAKRYASNSGSLTESVVSGMTGLDFSVILPKCPTGGVVMFVAEITPEQLFERQKDIYLHTTDVDQLPHYLRDTLDPEKVEVVPNDYVDIDHDTPNATFGYAPLNFGYAHAGPCIGGRFYRPQVDAGFDEDRQRIWAVETQNPTLSEDFYLCTTMHTKPFVVIDQDPFEVVIRGDAMILGHTVFGGHLVEANDDYEKVMEVAPQERIEKE